MGTGPRQVFSSIEANPIPSEFALPGPHQNFRHSGGPEHHTSEEFQYQIDRNQKGFSKCIML